MVQLKGHRSVGGMRASIYNAMPVAGVQRAGRVHEGFRAAARLSTSMTRYQILTLNQISSHGLHRFPGTRYTVGKAVEQPDAILVRSHDMHEMAIPASVKAIGRAGSGHQQHSGGGDVEARRAGVQCARRQCQRGQGAGARGAAARRAQRDPGARATSRGSTPSAADLEAQVEDGKKQFAGVELPQRTLGIVGLGAIGSLVADIAIKLGMKVIGFDPEITVDAAWRLPVERAPGEQHRGAAQAVGLRHAARAAACRDAASDRREAARGDEARRGAAQFRARRPGRRRVRVVAALRAASTQVLPVRFPQRRAAARAGRRRAAASGRLHRRKPRRTAPSWWSIRCASFWSTARSSMRSTSPTSRCRANRRTASRSPTPTSRTCWGRFRRRWRNAGLNIHNMVNKSRGEMAYTLVDVDSPVQDRGDRGDLGDRRRTVGAGDSGGAAALTDRPFGHGRIV